MLTELFSNLASTIVVSGGMTAPDSGTTETLTVREANGVFPVVRQGHAQFHFKDRNPDYGEEIFACIATDGPNWTVIRGAENTRPIAHERKFTIRQVITSEFLQRLGDGSTTELVNAVTVCGADNTGVIPADSALAAAAALGPTYLSSGVYLLTKPLNLLPGSTIISFGNVTLKAERNFMGDGLIELIDGVGVTRIENISLDGSQLGAGSDVYGIYAETRELEAELRNVRIRQFSNSGMIASGTGWVLDRVSSNRNFGSGFELRVTDTFQLGCRAIGNSRYGFVGVWTGCRLACIASENRLGDVLLPTAG